MTTPDRHLARTHQAGRRFNRRGLKGEVVMLNLLRLRAVAGHSAAPEQARAAPISSAGAFTRNIQHTLHFLRDSDGDRRFLGQRGPSLIGPESERRDLVMPVGQPRVQSFLASAQHETYLANIGHRTTTIEDSPLRLPLSELPLGGTA